jgi:3-oxoacyl-[acyl-carrier protein] reductase
VRVAIVTGSGRGMGRAMALGLAQTGIRVLVTDIDADVVEQVTHGIRAKQGSAIGIALDLTQEGAAEALVARAVSELGGLHIVVNNAGVGPEQVRPDFLVHPPKLWEVSPQAWRRTFAINTDAPYHMARAAVPHLLAQRWGRIVNVTTSLDTMMRAGYAPYGGSKAANEAHSAILAAELRGTGVTVNVLVPGGPANTRLIPYDAPLRREDLVQPEAMVAPLQWLVSDAAGEVTGRRFVAVAWSREDATEGAAIAWPQLAAARMPPGLK